MNRDRAADLLDRLRDRRVVVIGDYFLDEYVVGRAERLSREGPVPVLGFRRRFCLAGGAGNPVRNISALGAAAVAVGVVGDDAPAAELTALLAAGERVDVSGLIVDAKRPTSVKTRIVAEGLSSPHQVARIDRLERHPVDEAIAERLGEAIARHGASAHAILVSHYRSGVVVGAVCEAARAASRGAGILLAVDAQGDLGLFHDYHLIRVGRQDATESLGRSPQGEDEFRQVTVRLLDDLRARVVMVGRGADGTSVAFRQPDGATDYFALRPANVSEVFDVSGAGDTVIAVTTLALTAGATVPEAVRLANVAAGIVVRRLGVAAPTADEILAEWPY